MKVAFYGRVSTDDAQDPSLSIPRSLGIDSTTTGGRSGDSFIAGASFERLSAGRYRFKETRQLGLISA